MTGSYSSRCGAMKLSTGKVVTEGKEVKEIWQQYTEELYRRDPNATDSFNENIYEDEPEVMEIEVKEALRHISNRKSAGCDGIPIELLKAGGEEAVKLMTSLCNCIWKRKEWPTDWKKSVYVPIYKKGDKNEFWELPNDRADFARQQGAPAGHTEKAGGIPYPRATNRASRVQTRKRNT